MDELDLVLSEIGTNIWSIKFFVTASAICGSVSPNLIGAEFMNPILENYSCKQGNNSTDQCYYVDENNRTSPCTDWIYDTSMFHSTVAMEWNLVCDKARLHSLFQLLYTIGSVFGCILGSYIANRFGRKRAIEIGTFFSVIGSPYLMFAHSLSVLLTLRFVIGVANTMAISPSIILCMEICAPKIRPIVGVLLGFPFAFSMIMFSVMAYYIRDWRWLQLCTCYLLPTLIVGSILIDESPRWLLINGRKDEAISVLRKGYYFSKTEHAEETLELTIKKIDEDLKIKNVEKNEPWWSLVLSLFTHKDMGKITSIVIFIWLVQGTLYLSIALNADTFSSPFLYMGLIGLMRIPAYSFSAPITNRFGRKPVVATGYILSGAAIILVVVLNYSGIKIETLDLVITLGGFLLICMSFQVNFVYGSELFPTTVRPYGNGLAYVMTQIGFNVPALITSLVGAKENFVPSIIYGFSGLLSGILVLFLPETSGKPLVETFADLSSLVHGDKA